MKAMLIRTREGLRGATDADQAEWVKFKGQLENMRPGEYLRMEWARPRNGKHHRKFFALLSLITENSETYNTTEKALVAVKLLTGHFEPAVHPETGELIQVPKSVSYESMEQGDFERFYSDAIDAVLQHILPQLDRATAEQLMDRLSDGWL